MTGSSLFVPEADYKEGFRYAERAILPSGKKAD
jgi:hypothetical protein